MKILTIDIGTGTQDIFLFDSRLALENGYKMVLPSPTMMVHRHIKTLTARRVPIVLVGSQMGGGPAAWAVQGHLRSGLEVYATYAAALTLDDDPAAVSSMGVRLVSDDEARRLPPEVERVAFRDLDLQLITASFARFGVDLADLDALAVSVFDHGAAPPHVSDRQFRFDYLDQQLRQGKGLTAFAFLAEDAPREMTRLRAVAASAGSVRCPVVVMDTAPAAVLGATLDPNVAQCRRTMIVNIGNFHTLAFRLSEGRVDGLFEHHTGELDSRKLEEYLRALADGTLRHKDVFDDNGHGALVYASEPLRFGTGDFDVVVTGPRRGLFGTSPLMHTPGHTSLRPYLAVPFGDMMLTGCFGLLLAVAELLPSSAGAIVSAFKDQGRTRKPPWEP